MLYVPLVLHLILIAIILLAPIKSPMGKKNKIAFNLGYYFMLTVLTLGALGWYFLISYVK